MSNLIHPTAIVDSTVTLGKNNRVGPFCIISGKVTIGDNNIFRTGCVIGSPAEKVNCFDFIGRGVKIGDGCHFSEYVTVHSGTALVTTIGDNVIMLRGSHAGHDVLIGTGATISCNALIGGHAEIGKYATLGLGSIVHQFGAIGAVSFLGMGAVVPKNTRVMPGCIYVGNPIRFLKRNDVGLIRNKIHDQELISLQKEYLHETLDWKDCNK